MKKRPERKRMTPLLYIQQPHLKHPKAKMQDHYKYQEIQEPISVDDKSEDTKKTKESVNIEKKLGKGNDTKRNRNVSQEIDVKKPDTKQVEKSEIKKEIEQIESTKEYKLIQNEKKNKQGFKMKRQNESAFENPLEIDQEVSLENFIEERSLNTIDKQDEGKEKFTLKNGEGAIEMGSEQQKNNGEETNKKQTPQIRTPFQEKSLEEKLRDLQRSPVTVVKIRYEFITPKETYLGYFISQKDGVITIQDLGKGKKIQTIPLESLIEIKMVGI